MNNKKLTDYGFKHSVKKPPSENIITRQTEFTIRSLYKKWTAGEKENPFTQHANWRGHMVKGFVMYCLRNKK